MCWDEYFSKIDKDKQKILKKILNFALGYEVSAKKAMPYGVPGLKLNEKNLIAVATHKNHFGIYPFSPKVIESVKDQLGDLETAKGTIRFSYDDFPKDKLIKRLIDERKKEIT